MSLEDHLYPLLSAYRSLPRGTQFALGFAYRCVPQSWRLGASYREFQRLTEKTECWSAEQLRDYQLKELRRVLLHAANCCPFYQGRFAKADFRPEELRELEDLRNCPITDKRDLIDHIDEMVSNQFKRSERLYITTGGSTGVPVGFYLHKGVSRPKEHAFLEAMWNRAGYFNGARVAVIRGHVTSERTQGRVVDYDAARDWLMLSSYHLTMERLPEYLQAVERFEPDLLHA
ncbi:MAG TPA: hypothetical protein VK850_03130, partial [Candidatus Binatia bacterium]|nr:hypothetical protein [Candidatus Binatia bacterium]